MRLPSNIRKIGNVTGEKRVYIEDYVYTYLNGLGEEKSALPVRVALYGHACTGEKMQFFLIYGASCVVEELQNGREQEQIRRDYFPEYDLLGYVNIYSPQKLSEKEGYYIFYEANEPMQNYLVSCYKSKQAKRQQDMAGEPRKWQSAGEAFKKALLLLLTIMAAVSVITINEYASMNAFVETVQQVIQEAEKTG